MTLRPLSGALFACLLLAVAACEDSTDGRASDPASPSVAAAENPAARASGFDFWVLALSWSPGYCASEGERANRRQCEGETEHGFVVHGLWPQFERGYPEFCPTSEPLDVPNGMVRTISDLIPSAGLVRHQWKKHGSCSGLARQDYFDAVRAARARIVIPEGFGGLRTVRSVDPDSVEADFRAANPGLPAQSIAVTCDRRFLREVRICLTRDLAEFAACREVDNRSCRLGTVVVPPDDR